MRCAGGLSGSRAFFDLPEAIKRRYVAPDPKLNRGYFAEGTLAAANSTDATTAPDFRETFKMSREEIDHADPYYASETGRRVFTPNIWPGEIRGFDATWIEYYKAMEKVAFALMRLFALALDLPENSFDSKIDKHMTTMSIANYPDLVQEPLPGQLRCGAHTDFGAITILKAEDKPGGMALFLKRAGLAMNHVPYKGGGPALADVIANHLPVYFANMSEALPHAASGTIRLLAVSSRQRVPQVPDVPTVAELGYPGFETLTWNGLMAPAGTPKEIIDKLAREIALGVKDPKVVERLTEYGVDPLGSSPEEFATMIAADIALWSEAVKVADDKTR